MKKLPKPEPPKSTERDPLGLRKGPTGPPLLLMEYEMSWVAYSILADRSSFVIFLIVIVLFIKGGQDVRLPRGPGNFAITHYLQVYKMFSVCPLFSI